MPLDGKLVYGTAEVSWSHLTGEALPRRIQAGADLPAGTLNHDGLLVVQATRGFQDSTPARIARLTAQAQVCPSLSSAWLHRNTVLLSRLTYLPAAYGMWPADGRSCGALPNTIPACIANPGPDTMHHAATWASMQEPASSPSLSLACDSPVPGHGSRLNAAWPLLDVSGIPCNAEAT